MRAAVFHGPHQPPSIEEVATDTPGPRELRVRTGARLGVRRDPPSPAGCLAVLDRPREPQGAEYLGVHDLVVGLIGDLGQRAVIGIDRRVADHDVDRAEGFARLGPQLLHFLLAADVAGNGHRPAALPPDRPGHFLAGGQVAGGKPHPPPEALSS